MIASTSLASSALTKRASSALISASSVAPARAGVAPHEIVSATASAIEIPVTFFMAAPFLAGENSDVALAMLLSEIYDLFLNRGGVRFRVDKHQLLGCHIVDSIGLDVKVVVVADNKSHFKKLSSNRSPYPILSTN